MIDVLAASFADGNRPAIVVSVLHETPHVLPIESGSQFLDRVTSARPFRARPIVAQLFLFHCVNSAQANRPAVYIQRVRADDAHLP